MTIHSIQPLRDIRFVGRTKLLIVTGDRLQSEIEHPQRCFRNFDVVFAADDRELLAACADPWLRLIICPANGVARLDRLMSSLRFERAAVRWLALTPPGWLERLTDAESGPLDEHRFSRLLSELAVDFAALGLSNRPERRNTRLTIGDLELDVVTHRVSRNGQTIHLPPTTFGLLRVLMKHKDCVFSRKQLLDMVWGKELNVELRTVDAHIRRLRKALTHNGGTDVIRTVRGIGYAAITDPPADTAYLPPGGEAANFLSRSGAAAQR